jgi:hypothetical protein
MEQQELRLYSFVNALYLRPVQHGIQSAHLTADMFVKYSNSPSPEAKRLFSWAKDHKTMIILDGGPNELINTKYYELAELSTKLSFGMPFACFNEDDFSLGGIMTCCGCVLPECIYAAVNYSQAAQIIEPLSNTALTDKDAFYFIKDRVVYNVFKMFTPEWSLISMLKSCNLAIMKSLI